MEQGEITYSGKFDARFVTRSQAERYRDRFKIGKRAQIDRREQAALHESLVEIGPISTALDLPGGTGRFAHTLARHAKRVILADSSPVMLEIAKEDTSDISAEYLLTDAEKIDLANRAATLVFCHRFFPHIYSYSMRQTILRELKRVSDQYVLISFYPPGLRSRLRWAVRSLSHSATRRDQLATTRQFLDECRAIGLAPVSRKVLRKLPYAAFFLFERN